MQRKNRILFMLLILGIGLLGYELFVSRGETYYYTSLGIIVLSLLAFFLHFEKRRPNVMLLTMIAALCGIAIVSRIAFFFLPQIKPMAALVILSGVAFGTEIGFITGAVTAFVSNFYFGQGSWTPFQMFALGVIGAIAGILFYGKRKYNWQLNAYGFLAVFVIYGGIVDINTIFFTSRELNWKIVLSVYGTALPFNFLFALSTAFFLAVLKNPILRRIGRVSRKYCLIDKEEEK